MRKTKSRIFLGILLTGITCLIFGAVGQAQQFDVAIGFGTISAPSASEASGNHAPVSLTGGLYPSFSADFLLLKTFGVQGELAWRGGRGEYGGFQPYRPFFYDFNAMFAPRIGPHTDLVLLGGIGGQNTRFYTGTQVCDFSCQNFVSVNHFMGHFGAGIKIYPYKHVFIEPEAHLYLVHDNQEFSSGRAVRYGASIGYTFGGR